MKSPEKKEYYWKPPAKTPDQYEMTANDFSDDDSGEDGVYVAVSLMNRLLHSDVICIV